MYMLFSLQRSHGTPITAGFARAHRFSQLQKCGRGDAGLPGLMVQASTHMPHALTSTHTHMPELQVQASMR